MMEDWSADWCAHCPEVARAVEMLCDAFASGGKLLTCGCGGSAADASHIAGEMVKSFEIARPLPSVLADEVARAIDMSGGTGPTSAAGAIGAANASGRSLADRLQMGLACISLATDTSMLTAIANDIGSDAVFAQQVMALGRRGDALWCISASGNSESVVNAAVVGRTLGMKVIGLTGCDGGVLAPGCDVAIKVPSVSTAEIQQMHVCVYHRICREVERRLAAQA